MPRWVAYYSTYCVVLCCEVHALGTLNVRRPGHTSLRKAKGLKDECADMWMCGCVDDGVDDGRLWTQKVIKWDVAVEVLRVGRECRGLRYGRRWRPFLEPCKSRLPS